MIRNEKLEDISDGRLYDANDMVKAYCDECKGCYACCTGMGSSIILDPLDVMRLCKETGKNFTQLLEKELEVNVVDGLVLPNIRMTADKCPFLNDEGRCSIHNARPGFCRLFPLGRYYTDDGFRYILQIHECERAGRTKVKVSKWIDTEDLPRYTKYINDWHKFQKDMQRNLIEYMSAGEDETARNQTMLVLQVMYVGMYDAEKDFYDQFDARLAHIRSLLCMTE